MANISTAKKYFNGITEQDISRLNQIKSTYNREIGRVSSKLNEINFGVWNDPVSRALAKYQKKVSTKISDISTDVDNGGNLDNLIGSIKTLREKSKEYIEWYNYNPHAEYGRTDKESYEELQREIENRKNNLDRLGREIDQYASQIKGFTFRGVTPELKDVQIERPTEPKPKPITAKHDFDVNSGNYYIIGAEPFRYSGYIINKEGIKIPIFERMSNGTDNKGAIEGIYWFYNKNNFELVGGNFYTKEGLITIGSNIAGQIKPEPCNIPESMKDLIVMEEPY